MEDIIFFLLVYQVLGKTMMAQRIPTILPELTLEESLEVTKIHSIVGMLNETSPIIKLRPFRTPHYTITASSLIGGGRNPRPGEISLAHNGVLYLDEFPEYNKNTIEALRTPMEDGKVTISRLNSCITYPSDFILVASMNPCPCGYFGSDIECKCSKNSRKKYLEKISGPLLDRIDIKVEVNQINYQDLRNNVIEESSDQIKNRVERCRKIQQERYKHLGIHTNSQLTSRQIEKFCEINSNTEKILEKAFKKFKLSARAYTRVLKVARTIADMEESFYIEPQHVLEAIQYRNLSKKEIRN